MRILVGKTFGIGNACLSVPMIKALHSMGHEIDVLIGSSPDDFGSDAVFEELRSHGWVRQVYREFVLGVSDPYPIAIMAIPYDGRWRNGFHFSARHVMDCRKRPGNIERLGFDMWEKHEVEYMMENARSLGFTAETPDGSFLPDSLRDSDRVYLGIGYKRDPGGFGESKHFGNIRFSQLIDRIRQLRPQTSFVSSGPLRDMVEVARKISSPDLPYKYALTGEGLHGVSESFRIVSSCCSYLGNDTGMMHVAASCGLPTMGLFAYPDLTVKNPPFCKRGRSICFSFEQPSIDEIARSFIELVWGDA